MTRYRILAPAARELFDAATYYNEREDGLGAAFLDEYERGVGLVTDFPEAWGALDETYRRFLLRRFPFGIIYRRDDEGIVIVSVMHLSRRPDSWRENLE